MKVPFIIYSDLGFLLGNLSAKFSTAKINGHTLLIHCLCTVLLIQQKINLIIIEAKTIKTFCQLRKKRNKIINK